MPMPNKRNITPAKRRGWLTQYDEGDSFDSIAEAEGRDPRTVKSQIEKAVLEQEVRLARRDQIRGALQKHNEDLLGVVKTLRSEFHAVLDERFTPSAAFPRSNQVTRHLPGYVIDMDALVVQVDSGAGLPKLERLLKEHLKDERTLWRDIGRWRNSHREYVEECLQIGDAAASQFKHATGLEPIEEGGTDTGFHESMVAWACRLAIEGAGSANRRTLPELSIAGDEVRLGGSTLARSKTENQRKSATKTFNEFLQKMWHSARYQKIAGLKKDLDKSGASIRDRLEDILLFEYISGKCNVCKKHSL